MITSYYDMPEVDSVIVIGASAGGYNAIAAVIAHLPESLNAAIFVVLHLSRNSLGDVLVQHIQKRTPLLCQLAVDEAPIERGHVYVAPPDFHLMVKQGTMRVIKSPHENRWRPSIDVLFRSAAAAYDSRSIGIVLTGLLDDGTSGMGAIKRSGGKCIVQEPMEAEFADMPTNVLNNVEVDYRVPIADMGYVIQHILSNLSVSMHQIPEDIKIEAAITERRNTRMEELEQIGTRSNYTCPDCGGGLYEIKNDVITRFRCFTGHVYTANLLLEKQSEELEDSLWISIRMLEERRNLLQRMATQPDGNEEGSEDHKADKAEELTQHIERLKKLLISINKNGAKAGGYE